MMKIDGFRVLSWGVMLLVMVLFSTVSSAASKDEIIFTTAPTQPPEQTLKVYGPIAAWLSKETGKKVVLEPAKTFLEYTNRMRKGDYDLIFDGPQFVGWRMEELNHTTLAKLPGAIVFVVAVREDDHIRNVEDLAGKKVCSFSSPNLLTLGFLDLFPSAARQPVMVKAETFKGALDCLRNGRGVAAVMRDKFWEKRPAEQKQGLRLLYTSNTPYPHRAFSINKEVDAETRGKITSALLSDDGAKIAQNLLKRFRVDHFVLARDAEYRGMGRLLKPVWGFY
jgi:ABC-type phosphate/phosphonate transport system substrate-binding protein